jgi:ribose/xylose/arabinose/galactoside ABC-type transport system permease subunit
MNPAGLWQIFRRAVSTTEGGLALGTIVILAATTLLDERHTYWYSAQDSVETIARYAVMLGIFALGSAIVIISGGIDLSAGSMIVLGATTCATIILTLDPTGTRNNDVSLVVMGCGIAGAVIAGILVGSLHAWLITVIGLPPFIATLATMVGLRSFCRVLVSKVAGGEHIYLSDPKLLYLGKIWVPVTVFAALALFCWLLMSRTLVGRHLYALGGNEQAARLSGIRTDRLKWLAYCISAVLAAISGILYFGYHGSADPHELAQGYELNSIAAAVVGGCSLQGGIGTITGTIMGCLFLQVVIDGVAQVIGGGDADRYQGMIVGVVVAVAVTLNQLRRASSRGKQLFPGILGGIAILTLALFSFTLLPLIMDKTSGLTSAIFLVVVLIGIKAFQTRQSATIRPSADEPT